MMRFLFLFVTLFIVCYAKAFQALPDTINIKKLPLEVDSLLSAEEELPLDSLKSDDELLYKNNWNSTQVRYAQNILPPASDTITITLLGMHDHHFVMPYKGKVISKFGWRGRRMHTGTDIKLNPGDTVRCAFDGRVRLAKRFSGYGNLVVVRHTNGLETVYAHLSAIKVNVNDTVKAGDLIGLGGHTGRATCDHLHFETRLFGEPFDSGKYIDFQTFALKADKVYYKNKIFATDLADLGKKQTVQSSVAGGSSGKHVIRKGDNLWTIAKRYHTTVNKLCALNNISPQKTLKVGSVLRVN